MNRLFEPSTWAGVAGVLASAAPFLPATLSAIAQVGAATASGLAVALREKGGDARFVNDAEKAEK